MLHLYSRYLRETVLATLVYPNPGHVHGEASICLEIQAASTVKADQGDHTLHPVTSPDAISPPPIQSS